MIHMYQMIWILLKSKLLLQALSISAKRIMTILQRRSLSYNIVEIESAFTRPVRFCREHHNHDNSNQDRRDVLTSLLNGDISEIQKYHLIDIHIYQICWG